MHGEGLGRPHHVERVGQARDGGCPAERRSGLAGGVDEGGRLSEDSSRGEDDARDDGWHGSGYENLGAGLPPREAEGERGVALVARNGLERLLDDADQDGDVEHREREGARENREAPSEVEHEDEHAEETHDDGGKGGEGLDGGLRNARDGALGRVLGEEHRCAEGDGKGDQKREDEQVEGVEDLWPDAAALLELLGHRREEVPVEELARARDDDVADGGHESHEDDADDRGEDPGRHAVARSSRRR